MNIPVYDSHVIFARMQAENLVPQTVLPHCLTLLTCLSLYSNLFYRLLKLVRHSDKDHVLFFIYALLPSCYVSLMFYSMEFLMPGLVVSEETRNNFTPFLGHLLGCLGLELGKILASSGILGQIFSANKNLRDLDFESRQKNIIKFIFSKNCRLIAGLETIAKTGTFSSSHLLFRI